VIAKRKGSREREPGWFSELHNYLVVTTRDVTTQLPLHTQSTPDLKVEMRDARGDEWNMFRGASRSMG